jgi:hypothetical protein
VRAALADAQIDAQELGIEVTSLASLDVRIGPVEDVLRTVSQTIATIEATLDPTKSDGIHHRQRLAAEAISKLNLQLSAPQRAYEEYKVALKAWDDARAKVIGSPEHLGSLRQLEDALSRLPGIRSRLGELEAARLRKAEEIYVEKVKLRDDYGKYYGAVQRFLTTHPLAQSQQFKLTFNVTIAESGFSGTFLRLLNQRRVGTFSGVEEGSERLKEIIQRTNFDSVIDVREFLSGILKALREDQRPGRKGELVDLQGQLATGVTVSELYDFIYGLAYVEPIYNLRWDGKTLEQLSPGERGNLLLIFYLLIDQDNIPLVIDQPEENLDNNTVFRTLVPCVKEAKTRRQIIMVTHNPNLAIVCDAEQVICAEMKKDHGNAVTYISGSIENREINRKIVDVLEGTRPAFDKRDSKYLV